MLQKSEETENDGKFTNYLLPFNFESVKRVSHNMQTEYFFNSPNIVLKRLVLYLAVQDTSC